MKELVEVDYPDAEKIILILDNLRVHSYGAFYEQFDPEEARQLKNKIGFHYTPVNASWLNIAEIEISALSKQCLDRRINSIEKLSKEASIWAEERNKKGVKTNWSFTTDIAREKMKRKYERIRS